MKIERKKNEKGETVMIVEFVLPSPMEHVAHDVEAGIQAGTMYVTVSLDVPEDVPWGEYDRIGDTLRGPDWAEPEYDEEC